jgi:MYXO-CTERM domain-containing protein
MAMGSIIRPSLFAAPLLLAAPVHAQQTEGAPPGFQLPSSSTAPAPSTNQQGPELNVYRDPVTPRATPPVVTPSVVVPTVTPPPATVQPTPQASRPRPAPTPAQSPSTRPADRVTPAPTTRTPAAAPPSGNAPDAVGEDEPANSAIPATPLPQPVAPPAANAIDSPEPAATPAPAATDEGSTLPWIIGGAVALIALAAAFLLRRRRSAASSADEAAAPAIPPRTPAPVAKPAKATPDLAPEPTATLHTPVAAPAATTDRPWIDMDMAVAQARYSLMGVTINYALILHNRGDRPAQDILVRGMIGNGSAQQQAVLQGFFTGQDGLPLHSAVSIAPGETIQLVGELRLSPDQIVPVDMGQRSLLIPLAAFDSSYRWGADDGDPMGQPEGQGRTARAFIVGQEQEPPADRLAPLRLDQGPRQYRRPAARAAAELTPA